ncbi:glycoside hydrolase family 128 protein [Melanomma pulvis-pyrius CBS 109.77]|uniref:Glycoside hydrolase family 128 protein n=1 Tax=Melanomma pulvis-pyrius CBS 109.77 TaxID=1314802 RepID=A0A6A6XUM7_9PLEO|nr:glycoside hydrolase family 128 protein [Melanomma pulvis-pyrius CBS 109.77]
MQSSQLTTIVALAILLTSPVQSATSPKRGLCHIPSNNHPSDDKIWRDPNSKLTWYYNYRATPSPAYLSDSPMHFVPMLWGSAPSTPSFLDTVTSMLDNGRNITYVLGFNEPDGPHRTGGSNIPADLAAIIWKSQIEPLKKRGVQLGAPAVTGSPNGFTWLENWFRECDGGCNPDFVPIHWYGDFEGLASQVGQVMGTYPDMKIWVTEWGLPHAGLEETQMNYNISTEWFDRMEVITHYSYFGAFRSDVSNVGPNSAMLTQKGQLSDIGSWYLGRQATKNVPKGTGGKTGIFTAWVVLVSGVVWAVL